MADADSTTNAKSFRKIHPQHFLDSCAPAPSKKKCWGCILRKLFALVVLSASAILLQSQIATAQSFTLTSFNVSPGQIVEPSNQTLTYSASVTPTPTNQSLHVTIADQLS